MRAFDFKFLNFKFVQKINTDFWLVVIDGVAESFCGQLIIMPLIVYTAEKCDDGVEGSLFALMMSISNVSNVLGDELGALLAAAFKVDETKFDNLIYIMIIL